MYPTLETTALSDAIDMKMPLTVHVPRSNGPRASKPP